MWKRFVTIWLFTLLTGWISLSAQDPLSQTLDIPYQFLPLREAFTQIEAFTDLSFSYNSMLIPPEKMVHIQSKGKSLREVLDNLLNQENIRYQLIGDNIVLYYVEPELHKYYTISGYVRDAQTLEGLPGAHVFTPSVTGTSTNEEGFFSLRLPPDSLVLGFSYLGYRTQRVKVNLNRNVRLQISLKPSLDLQEITVMGLTNDEEDSLSLGPSTSFDAVAFSQRLPAVGGEYDPVKALQLLPGAQSGNEGTSGLYVRGGSPDQNLVLFDGVPIYYPNHLFGLFSVFNASVVRKAQLIKGPYPARYGGRLSSILSVHSKDSNLDEISGEINLGLIAANLAIDIPIKKDKTGLVIAGRQSYMDFYLQPISRKVKENNGEIGSLGYRFGDFNLKFSHYFSPKDKLEIFFYNGEDRYNDNTEISYVIDNSITSLSDISMNWQNLASGIKYSTEFPNKLYGQFHLWQSRYAFQFKDFSEVVEFFENEAPQVNQALLDYHSEVSDIGMNIDFDYYLSASNQVRFGTSFINHRFKPGANALFEFNQSLNTTIDTTFNQKWISAQEMGLYLENDVRVNSRTKANVGIHIAVFLAEKNINTSIQPRLSVDFMAHPDILLGASFSMMTQYLHLLTNSSLGLPTDLWIPTIGDLKPQNSRQGTLKAVYTARHGWSLKTEVFYKSLENQVTYLNESRFLLSSEELDRNLTLGSGRAYGVEFLIRKQSPRFQGLFSYTLGRSERKFDLLNEGRTFPFKYDRRHDISMALFYKFNKKVELSGSWVYGSGNVITLPESEFEIPNPASPNYPIIIYNYGDRNNFRLPAYHRLDIGIRFESIKTWGKQVFNIGVYNLYNRQNPFFISLNVDREDPQRREFTQTSLFPIMPTLRYQINF